jgi:hypothetical protein
MADFSSKIDGRLIRRPFRSRYSGLDEAADAGLSTLIRTGPSGLA